jgi:hypothetical protein
MVASARARSMIELALSIVKYVVPQLEVGPEFAFNSEVR